MELRWHDPQRVFDKLQALPHKLKGKVLRGAARKAVNIWRDAARQTAKTFDDPDTPLDISKFITTGENRKLGKREGGIAMRVGVRGGARTQKGEPVSPYYWRFKEFGTAFQQAEPFMRPAQQRNLHQAIGAVIRETKAGLDRIVKEAP